MKITHHGTWYIYKPNELPEGVPPGVMFARRAGDNVDWYEFVNGKHFAVGTIKMTVTDGIVSAAVLDAAGLFPGNADVLEVHGVTTPDPQETFGDKIYDAANQTFNDPPKRDPGPSIADLLKRIEALENKGP